MGGKSSKTQVVGYKYYMGLHMGLCRGPVDQLVEIKVGGVTVWNLMADDGLTANTSFQINSPFAFGGDQKEGGIVGQADLHMGAEDQTVFGQAPALMNDEFMSGWRGVTSLFYYGQICSNNPYPKPWTMRVRRWSAGWEDDDVFYPEKIKIHMMSDDNVTIFGFNPAHIIYQCLTDTGWGRGITKSKIDDVSFMAAADTLWDEEFGLCLKWNRQQDISDFIQTVINHIAAVLYIDKSTGKLSLLLIRQGSGPTPLNLSTGAGLLDITEDSSSSADTVYNEVIVQYHSPTSNTDGSVRVQNIASFQTLGCIISTTTQYLGIPNASLALRVAQRDVMMQSTDLRRFTLICDRKAWSLLPGMRVTVSCPERGIGSISLRVVEATDSTLTDGKITIKAVQDIFDLPATSYVAVQPSTYTPPDRSAHAVELQQIEELTWLDLSENLTDADLSTVQPDAATVKTYGKEPSDLALDYLLATEAEGETEFVERGVGAWSSVCEVDAVGYYDTEITFSEDSLVDETLIGDLALLGDEYVRVDDIDMTAKTMTIARGCVDTIPQLHPDGTVMWFDNLQPANDGRQYTSGETVSAKLITRTNTAVLDPDLATVMSIDLVARQDKPYPPGNMKTNGDPALTTNFVDGGDDIVFTWAHRDRINQSIQVVDTNETSIGPEDGVTYTIRVYDGADTLLRTVTGLTTDTWTYDTTMYIADGSPDSDRFEIESVRDSVVSLMIWNLDIARTPLGFDDAFDHFFDGVGP